MLKSFFDEPAKLTWATAGPFKDHVTSFARHLTEQGYARASGRAQLFVVRGLGIWLDASGLSVESLSDKVLDGFLAWRRPLTRLMPSVGAAKFRMSPSRRSRARR